MDVDMKENVTRRSIWLRLCYMVIMSIAFSLAEAILFAVVAFQFLSSLFTARTNDQLIRFGRNMARYLQQITAYLTFVTEDLPFPFAPWPDEPHEPAPAAEEPPEPAPVADPPPQETSVEAAPPEENPTEEAPPQPAPAVADQPEEAPTTEVPETRHAEAGETKAEQGPQTAVFGDGDTYQKSMGDRSRRGGAQFTRLLGLPAGLKWLEVGCGTGAFSAVILENCDPAELVGVDSSEQQISYAQETLGSERAHFRVGDATALPFEVDAFDVAVSSYVLNFVPDRQKMMDELARVVRAEGTVAVSVFDHAGGRTAYEPFWDLVEKRDPAFHKAEYERRGWNITHPDALATFFEIAGLERVAVDSFEVEETYSDFEEYWNALTGTLPTSGINTFLGSLDQDQLDAFKEDLRAALPTGTDGSIKLTWVSWLVRGKVPA